jgi:hypothetical protein
MLLILIGPSFTNEIQPILHPNENLLMIFKILELQTNDTCSFKSGICSIKK